MADLIKLLGLSGVVLAAVAWLAREIIRDGLRREAERIVEGIRRDSALLLEQVRRDAQLEIERHKHEMALEAEKSRIRFTHLQEKRSQLLEELYAKIAAFLLEASFLKIHVSAASSVDDQTKALVDGTYGTMQGLLQQYQVATLYLPKDVSDEIWGLINPADTALRRAKACVENSCQIQALRGTLATVSLGSSVRSLLPSFHSLLGVDEPIVQD